MQLSRVDALNTTFEKTNLWLRHLAADGGFIDERQAYTALRAVLHALRDRLRADDAVHLAAQLPMLLRGMYYEGWKPSRTPVRDRTLDQFLDHIDYYLGWGPEVDAEMAAIAVFNLLQDKITPGEIDNVINALPREIQDLWYVPNEPIRSSTASETRRVPAGASRWDAY